MSHDFLAKVLPYLPSKFTQQAAHNLDNWIKDHPQQNLHRLNVASLSKELSLNPDDLLSVFLAGVLEGYWSLRWDFHCPHCHGLASFHNHLASSKSEDYCGHCQVGFANTLDQNVEVTFSSTAQIRPLPDGFEEQFMAKMLAKIKNGTWQMPEQYISGLDCMHNDLFQKYFSDDVLSSEESLEVKSITLLFTDIQGSTKLYDTLGDAKAYRLVRDHFAYLFKSIEQNHGAVVKTIGDAVMASFQTPINAFQSVVTVFKDIQKIQIPQVEKPIQVKFGIHSGPAIVVNLNNRLDYFGHHVNMAARIQDLAKGHQLFFSDRIFQDTKIQTALVGRRITRFSVKLKGIQDKQTVYALDQI